MSDHPHIFELFDPGKYIQAFELEDREHTVTIVKIVGEQIEGEEGRKAKKPVLYLEGWPRPLVLNKTNAKTLIALYGPDYRTWAGKRFTMFPTVVKFGKDDVDAIRMRKKVPAAPSAQQRAVKPIAERVALFRETQKNKETAAEVETLWRHSATKALLAEVDPETRDRLELEYAGRLGDIEAAEKFAKEQAL